MHLCVVDRLVCNTCAARKLLGFQVQRAGQRFYREEREKNLALWETEGREIPPALLEGLRVWEGADFGTDAPKRRSGEKELVLARSAIFAAVSAFSDYDRDFPSSFSSEYPYILVIIWYVV